MTSKPALTSKCSKLDYLTSKPSCYYLDLMKSFRRINFRKKVYAFQILTDNYAEKWTKCDLVFAVLADLPLLFNEMLELTTTSDDHTKLKDDSSENRKNILKLLMSVKKCCSKSIDAKCYFPYHINLAKTVLELSKIAFERLSVFSTGDMIDVFLCEPLILTFHITKELKNLLGILNTHLKVNLTCSSAKSKTIHGVIIAIQDFCDCLCSSNVSNSYADEYFSTSFTFWEILVSWILSYAEFLNGYLDPNTSFKKLCKASIVAINFARRRIEIMEDMNSCNTSVHIAARYIGLVTYLYKKLPEIDTYFIEFFRLVLNAYSLTKIKHMDDGEFSIYVLNLVHDKWLAAVLKLLMCVAGKFMTFVMLSSKEVADLVEQELWTALCIFKTNVIVQKICPPGFPFVCCHNSGKNVEIFNAYFNTILYCQNHLSMNSYVGNECGSQTSVHSFLVSNLICITSAFCAIHYHIVENFILEALYSGCKSFVVMSCDIWCHLIRLGPTRLGFNQCFKLTEMLYNEVSAVEYFYAVKVVRRLLKFLSPNHKLFFFHKYFFSSTIRKVNVCKNMHQPVVVSEPSPEFMHEEIKSMNSKLQLYHFLIAKHCGQFESPAIVKIVESRYSEALMQINTTLSKYFNGKDILQALMTACAVWKTTNMCTKFAVLGFLRSIKSSITKSCSERSYIIELTKYLLVCTLDEKNVIFHHDAMCVFKEFAELTPNSHLVRNTLRKAEISPKEVKQFLTRTYGNCSSKNVLIAWRNLLNAPVKDTAPKFGAVCRYSPKEKIEKANPGKFEILIEIHKLADSMVALEKMSPLPIWARTQLKFVSENIMKLC